MRRSSRESAARVELKGTGSCETELKIIGSGSSRALAPGYVGPTSTSVRTRRPRSATTQIFHCCQRLPTKSFRNRYRGELRRSQPHALGRAQLPQWRTPSKTQSLHRSLGVHPRNCRARPCRPTPSTPSWTTTRMQKPFLRSSSAKEARRPDADATSGRGGRSLRCWPHPPKEARHPEADPTAANGTRICFTCNSCQLPSPRASPRCVPSPRTGRGSSPTTQVSPLRP